MKIKTQDEIKPSLPGQIVCKPSGKPFSNGSYIDEVLEILINPQNPKNDLGAKLKHCEDIVDVRNLKVLGLNDTENKLFLKFQECLNDPNTKFAIKVNGLK